MTNPAPPYLRPVLSEKLAESLRGPIPKGTPRSVLGYPAPSGKAIAVVGMRRVGKTTFVHQIRRERLEGGSPRGNLPYLNFEDERLGGMVGGHLSAVLEEYGRSRPRALDSGQILWCFDEIQVVPGWESFVRRLLDQGHEVIVTGSSAAMLSREIATSLRGRAWEVDIFPFSFDEFLRHGPEEVPKDRSSLTGAERAKMESAMERWLRHGGFPEAQKVTDFQRRQLLTGYVDVAILRDVVERYAVGNVQALRWLVRQLLSNAGGSFSVHKFHNTLRSEGLSVSKDTIHAMVGYLEDCFLVRNVWVEARSERHRMSNPRKCYPVDTGLIPVFDRSGRANLGHALQTAVLVELQRRRCEVSYVRTEGGCEVDFLSRRPDGSVELIQVCADADDPTVLEREVRSLERAKVAYPDAERTLVTLRRLPPRASLPDGTADFAAHEWLL